MEAPDEAELAKQLEEIEKMPDEALTEEDRYARAKIFILHDEFEKAKKDLLYLYRNKSSIHSAILGLGRIFENEGEYEAAEFYYREALKYDETSEKAYSMIKNLAPKLEFDKENALVSSLKVIKSDSKFSDIVGMTEVKSYVTKHVILPLQHPELVQKYKKNMGIGLMLFGSPGNGKTFIIKAVAGEAGVGIIIARISQIIGEYVGSTEKNLHALFLQASIHAPCILFFDELDALGTKRSQSGGSDEHGGNDVQKRAVNQFLVEMNGLETKNNGVYIIGSTNRPWDLDPALRRSGRFGDTLYVKPPNHKERIGVFKLYLEPKPHAHINYNRIARATMGYSYADISKICDDATLTPMIKEAQGHRSKITTKGILNIIKATPSSIDQWYLDTRKEIIGHFDYEVYDKKVHEKWKSGNLESEEKLQYRDLIKDIKKNTSSYHQAIRTAMRLVALYLS